MPASFETRRPITAVAPILHAPTSHSVVFILIGPAIRVHMMIYEVYQAHTDIGAPARLGAAVALSLLKLFPTGTSDRLLRRLAAALELISRAALTYKRPSYGIHRIKAGKRDVEGTEKSAQ